MNQNWQTLCELWREEILLKEVQPTVYRSVERRCTVKMVDSL
jgi:hypothetical protein